MAGVATTRETIGFLLLVLCWWGGAEAGSKIELNGKPYNVPWQQNDKGQIFIQDHWVRRAVGVTFLSSDRPEQQRYQWYGAPTFANSLFVPPSRLLQIDNIKADWRTEITGDTLKIFTPDAKVTEIRRNSTDKGERITLLLSRPTPWQQSQVGNQLTVTVAAETNNPNSPRLTQSTDRITQLQIRPAGKETTIDLQFNPNLIPQVRTLSNPPRLVIDLEENFLPPPQRIAWLPGITWREEWLAVEGKRWQFYGLEINPQQQGISFRPIWANQGMTGTVPLNTIATVNRAVAAINGGFFNRDRQLPVSPIKREGVWYSGAVFERGAVAWNDRHEFTFDRLNYRETITLPDNQKINLTNLNSGFVQKGIARYLPSWGEYTNLTDNETIVTVQDNRVVQNITVATSFTQKFLPPPNGYLLVARQVPEITTLLAPQTLVKGEVSVRPSAFNQLPHLLGGGPLLLQNGKPVADAHKEGFSKTFATQAAPRSVIARLKNNNLLLLTLYPNPTLEETTKILQQLGAVDALNLDGGSSTGLWLGGTTVDKQGETRPVHNALAVFYDTNAGKNSF